MFFKKIIVSLALVLFASLQASAHVMWVNAGEHSPKADKQLTFTVGWGHQYFNPAQSILVKGKALKEFYLIDSKGEKIDIESINDFQYRTEEKIAKGTCIAVVTRENCFVTKTKSGKKMCSKEGLDDVINSRYVIMGGKAIINSGKSKFAGVLSKPVGLDLEIVPLSNPSRLRKGKNFRFKLLYKGKPVSEKFNATYQGFDHKDGYSSKGKTNRKGIGSFRLKHQGRWLIKVQHKEKYPDQKKSDIYSLTTSLTFEIK